MRIIAQINFSLSTGVPLFNAHVRSETINSGLRINLASKTKHVFFGMAWSIFRYLEPVRRDSRVWQKDGYWHADGWRDGRTDILVANAALTTWHGNELIGSSMNVLSQMQLWTRKTTLNVGSHLDRDRIALAELCTLRVFLLCCVVIIIIIYLP